jgi:hypothetical protein
MAEITEKSIITSFIHKQLMNKEKIIVKNERVDFITRKEGGVWVPIRNEEMNVRDIVSSGIVSNSEGHNCWRLFLCHSFLTESGTRFDAINNAGIEAD